MLSLCFWLKKSILEAISDERLINEKSSTMSTWGDVMAMRPYDKRHKGVANTLTQDELETVIATIDFFGDDYRQDIFDLKVARYRVFDWLAMRVQGRGAPESTKVLAYSFVKVEGDIDKWIQDLRETDYDIDRKWEALELGV